MKKTALITAFFIIVLALLASSFVGCTGSGDSSDTEQSGEGDEKIISVFDNGKTDYRIIWPSRVSDEEFNAMRYLVAAMKESGVEIENFRDDTPSLDESDFEILIGKTNRTEGADIIKNLKVDDYVVAIVGKKIIISGGSNEKTLEAAQKFIDDYITGAVSSLSVPENLNISVRGEYPVADFSINGVNINEFVIVRPDIFNKITLSAAELMQDLIVERTGVQLRIVTDRNEAEPNEIRIGHTSRSGEKLSEYEYQIKSDNGSVILSGGLHGVSAAVISFVSDHLPEKSETPVNATVPASSSLMNTKNRTLPAEPTLDGKRLVALCDQLNATLAVIDLDAPDITAPSAVVWSWRPTAALGFTSTSGYGNSIDEATIRYSDVLSSYVVCVTSSAGFMAVVKYPSGECVWWGNAAGYGPHAIEYLPNGNVAVAISGNTDYSKGCLRIYAASQGKSASNFFNIQLSGAHGVVWDDINELLWVLGDSVIHAYRIGGTDKNPTAIKVDSLSHSLPTGGGHNLSAHASDPDLLWISCKSVYLFQKSTGLFITDIDGYSVFNATLIKSIDNYADGTIIRARATNVYKAHNTDTLLLVTFDNTGAAKVSEHVFANRAFYKARRFDPNYT